jgi:hypothetical protein
MMLSQRKISANQRNAQRSTGPRTVKGKARSKRNSWQHGLSVKLASISPMDSEIERLAIAIAGWNLDPLRLHFAVIAAEAEMELLRVRAVRKFLISSKIVGDRIAAGSEQAAQAYGEALPDLPRLDRYERRAVSRRNRALQLL